jgi:hypothetical protein
MRLFKINLLAFALVLLSVSVASAITIRLENTANPNQVAVYLDMNGDLTNGVPTKVTLINVSVQSNDADLTYLGAQPAPLLPIGTAGILLNNFFQSLSPTGAYGQESVSASVPPGTTWALVDFFGQNPTDGINTIFGTTPENVLMATLNYDAQVFAEYFGLAFGVDGGFFINNGVTNVPINEQVNLVNNLASIPEPTTALLVGLGLVGLGVAGRRKA